MVSELSGSHFPAFRCNLFSKPVVETTSFEKRISASIGAKGKASGIFLDGSFPKFAENFSYVIFHLFIFHLSSFIFHLSSFIFRLSSFVFRLSSFLKFPKKPKVFPLAPIEAISHALTANKIWRG